MNKNYYLASLGVSILLGLGAQARADYVTVLPTPVGYGPISHEVSGALSPVQVSATQNLVEYLSAQSDSNPGQLYANAVHILVENAFLVTSAELSRTADGSALITGDVLFKANQNVFYSLAGQLDVTGSNTAGLSRIQSSLMNYDTQATLFDFDYSDSANSSTYLDLISAPGSLSTDANGFLTADSTYLWHFEMSLNGNATASDVATATGELALVFSYVGGPTAVPEPASAGVLACAMGGWMLRRKR